MSRVEQEERRGGAGGGGPCRPSINVAYCTNAWTNPTPLHSDHILHLTTPHYNTIQSVITASIRCHRSPHKQLIRIVGESLNQWEGQSSIDFGSTWRI